MSNIVFEWLLENLGGWSSLIEHPVELEAFNPLIKSPISIFDCQTISRNLNHLFWTALLIERFHELFCYRWLTLENFHAFLSVAFLFINLYWPNSSKNFKRMNATLWRCWGFWMKHFEFLNWVVNEYWILNLRT